MLKLNIKKLQYTIWRKFNSTENNRMTLEWGYELGNSYMGPKKSFFLLGGEVSVMKGQYLRNMICMSLTKFCIYNGNIYHGSK